MSRTDAGFSRNVFINCPFDPEYVALLSPLLFTLVYLGYVPRIASESLDSGTPRIEKIVQLITESKFSIHDLSRLQSSGKDEFYRLNMPFELGIDYGYRTFAEGDATSKRFLILEREPYRYQRALSDLSGSDISNHNDEPEDIVRAVRNWFREMGPLDLPNATVIWDDFNLFLFDFYQAREEQGYRKKDLRLMPTREYLDFIQDWLEGRD